MLDRFVGAVSHPQGYRHDVVGVIAVGVLAEGALQVIQRTGVIAGIQRYRRGVDLFGRRFRYRRLSRRLALAHAQIQARSLEELAFVGVTLEHGPEEPGGTLKIVALEGLNTAFVDRYRFVEAGLSHGDGSFCRWGHLWRWGRRLDRLGSALGWIRPCGGRLLATYGPLDAPNGLGGLHGPALLRQSASCSLWPRHSNKTPSGGSSASYSGDRRRTIRSFGIILSLLKQCKDLAS
jgi:hypothetical protein